MQISFKKHFILQAFLLIFITSIADITFAASRKKGSKGAFAGGAVSIGAGFALSTAEQTGINSMVDAAKAAANSSASKLSTGTEYLGYATFRFANGFTAIQIRPSYFTQSSSGSGSDGSHSYDLTGFTIFPLARLIPLSNELIDFYIQGGLGYAKLDGNIKNGVKEASFSGSGFGVQAGLGAEFCFIPSHCFAIEGNYRYLPISRNIVSSGSGLPFGTTQAQADKELEDASGNDLGTTLSGVSGIVSYVFNF